MVGSTRPSYLAVFRTFVRNSAVRDMTFRVNFILQCITSLIWMGILLIFYMMIFTYTDEIGRDSGWGQYQFFIFLATTMFVNSLMQAFVMRNAEQFSELIRTGNLDFVLLKPIDTQFLVSFQRVEWSALTNFAFGAALLVYSLLKLGYVPSVLEIVLYPLYILCGVAIMYSLIICLAATSVWMGRNQSLYNFWFYITTFSRYPMEIYEGPVGNPLKLVFTFAIPILIAINVPARLMAWPLAAQQWSLAGFALLAVVGCQLTARFVFTRSLLSYRSASS